jgi:epoxyqueuosine reductase
MVGLSNEIKEELARLGADIIGIGDLSGIPTEIRENMRYGISVAVVINPEIVKRISEGPTEEYYETYFNINNKLDEIVSSGAEFLHKKGYEAIAQTREVVSKNESQYNTILPHKTIATRSGIGWIGKCALLVTEKYGSAIRISAILTNAPLEKDVPVNESYCGDCIKCRDACPGEAVKGVNWSIHSKREDFFEPEKCRRAARRLSKEILNKEITLCGKCFYVCPYTQKYLQNGL